MTFEDLLDTYGRFCPRCGSGQVSSRNGGPLMHGCLDCKHRFDSADAVIGRVAAEVRRKEYLAIINAP